MAEAYRGMVVGSIAVFQHALDGGVKKYVVINIMVLGALFGLSNLFGTLQTTPELPLDGKYALITPLIFSTAGIVIICVALIGFTMVYWAAAIAFGGYGGLGLVATLIGLCAIPFWILAPLLNYTLRFSSAGANGVILYLLIVLAFLWSCKVIRQSLITGQGIVPTKATVAVAAMWIFSISAIYVFLP